MSKNFQGGQGGKIFQVDGTAYKKRNNGKKLHIFIECQEIGYCLYLIVGYIK